MNKKILGFSSSDLKNFAEDIIKKAKKTNVDAIEVDVSVSSGRSITVRHQDVETSEIHNDKNLTLSLFKGKKRGIVSSSDFSSKTINFLIDKAKSIMNNTEGDSAFGIASLDQHPVSKQDLDIFFPHSLNDQAIIDLLKSTESSGIDFSHEITNSEGSTFTDYESNFIFANSNDFFGGFSGTRFSLSCSLIAGRDQFMQRDSDYSNVRCFDDLKNNSELGQDAARKVILKLNPRKIKTKKYPVIFHHDVSGVILSSLVSAISGMNLYKQNSFLMDTIGKKIGSKKFNLFEDPFLPRGHASTYFDDEGVAVKRNSIVEEGILNHYLLSNYSAKKLGLASTGNAGGTHNLVMATDEITLDHLIGNMKEGVLVTDLLGHGLNMVNGDFSRGANGFYIKDGQIMFPVEEITVAGNMKDIFMNIEAISNDINTNSSRQIGSVWINTMTVASAS